MKKIFSIVFLFTLAASVFAASDLSIISLNAGIGFPQQFKFVTASDDVEKEQYSGIGLNFGLRGPVFNEGAGLFLDGTWYAPIQYKITYKSSGDETVTETYSASDMKNSWGLDGLLGAYFVLFSTDRFCFPVGLGAHLNFSKVTAEKNDIEQTAESYFQVGLGALANIEFALTEKINVYGGVRLAWDFFQNVKYTQEWKKVA